jgi:penicillin-binding protein 2
MARRTGIEAISAMGRKLGLGQVHPVGIALQKAGLMPTPAWKLGRFNKPWLGGETVIAGIGQGYVLTTPLQLALMTGRIATGRAIVPTLVDAVPETGTVAGRATGFAPLDINPVHLDAVRKGMVAVVNEDGGTGSNARLEDNSIRVAGKTGTSQVTRRSADAAKGDLAEADRDHALFVAYLPADKPRYAVAAVVEHGGGGGATAAPLVRDVIELVLADQVAARPQRKGATGPDDGGLRKQGRG